MGNPTTMHSSETSVPITTLHTLFANDLLKNLKQDPKEMSEQSTETDMGPILSEHWGQDTKSSLKN